MKNTFLKLSILFSLVLFSKLVIAEELEVSALISKSRNYNPALEGANSFANPDGKLKVSQLSESVIKLTYNNEKNNEESVKIHLNFSPFMETAGDPETLQIVLLAKNLAPQILQTLLSKPGAILYLDSTGTFGFARSDYDFNKVMFLNSGGENLASIVFSIVSASVANQKVKNKGIGFLSDYGVNPKKAAFQKSASCKRNYQTKKDIDLFF